MLKKKYIFYGIIIILIILIIYFLYIIRQPLFQVIRPILFALVLAYFINPFVNRLEEKKVPRSVGIIIIYIFVMFNIALILIYLIPELINSTKDLAQKIPKYFEEGNIIFYDFVIRYQHSDLPVGIKNTLDQNIFSIQNKIIELLQNLISFMTGIFTFIFDFFLAIVIAYYIVKDIDQVKNLAISFIPRKGRQWCLQLIRDINLVLSGFIRGQLIVAGMISIIIAIGLWVIGIKYILILSIISGLSNIIPYFGPILGAVPVIIVAFLDKPIKALWAALLYFVVQQLEGDVISPKIVGNTVGLHPALVIIVIFAGGVFGGVMGMILAVPITGIVKVIGNNIIKAIV